MKNPLKLALLLAGVAVLTIPVLRAEDTTPPADNPEHSEHGPGGPGRRNPGAMMERLAKELNLTADQQAKWKEIGEQERAAMAPIWNDKSLSREDKRAKMKEVHDDYAAQRRAVLTPEQQQKFDELLAKMRARRQGGEGGWKPKNDQ